MAEENTITTVFRADISQFSASTQQLNQYVRVVNSEFNEAVAGMGKWSDSTDGLNAKITQLNKVLQAEKTKLSSLEDQYNALTDEQKKTTKQGQQLAIQINNQRGVVKKTESQIDGYSSSLKELTDAGVKTRKELDDLNKKMKENGDTAESTAGKLARGLGKGLLGVGAAAAGAVGGFLAMAEGTREYRQGLNQLETAFGRVGFSAEETYEAFNYFGSVLGDTKKAQETMLVLGQLVDSEKELESWTDTLTGVFATYGEAIPLESMSEAIVLASKQAVAEGGLADALEWGGVNLEDFNAKLESLNSEEERSAYIQKTLNGLYGEAAENYKELNKDVLDASTAQTNLEHAMAKLGAVAEPIMTMLKNAMADFLTALEPAVKLIGEGLKGAFEGSAEGAEKFAQGITGLAKSILGKLQSMLPTVIDIAAELIPSLIQAILDAIPSLASTLAQAVSQVAKALGKMIPQIVSAVISAIPQIIDAVLDAIPTILDAFVQFWMAIIDALPKVLNQLISMLPKVITTIINSLISFIPQLVQGAITLFMAIVDAIPFIVQALVPQIPTIVNAVIDGLLSMLPVLLEGATTLLMAIVQALPTIIKSLIKEVPKIVTTIVNSLLSRMPELIQGAIQLFMGILQAIPQICGELIKNLPEIISTIVKGLLDGIPDLIKAGADLLAGLFKGLLDPSVIWENIKSLGNSILDGVKSFFGINSPSKLFEDQIGKNLALGIGEGFEDEIGQVNKEMDRAMAKLTPEINAPSLQAVGSYGGAIAQQENLLAKLSDLIAKAGNITNNYNISNKFERMETTQYALHKSNLELKRILKEV